MALYLTHSFINIMPALWCSEGWRPQVLFVMQERERERSKRWTWGRDCSLIMAACLKLRDRSGLNNMERCLFCPPCLFHCTGVVGVLPAPRHPPLWPTGHSLPRNEIIPMHRCQKALQYSPLPPQIPPPTCLCGQCHSPTHALPCQHTHTLSPLCPLYYCSVYGRI